MCFAFLKTVESSRIEEKGEGTIVRLFHKKSQAIKNWRNRALMINFRTTRLTITEDENNVRKVPEWAYKEFVVIDS
jgi:hypothetical protein